MRHPIIMSSYMNELPDTSVPAGMTYQPDMERLSNPYGLWSILTEIRFFVSFAAFFPDTPQPLPMGGYFSAKFTMGSFGITNQFVPLPMFCTQMEEQDENVYGFPAALLFGAQAGTGSYSMLRWKLPEPLLVPPLTPLHCTLRRDLADPDPAVSAEWPKVKIAYLGEQLTPDFQPPKMAKVPYVSYQASTSPIGAGLSLQSPFLVPLHVQRLVGTTSNTSLMRIRDTKGFDVVKDFTPQGAIFDIPRRAWTFNRVLQPNEAFTIYSQPAGSQVCLIGWREEQYS